MAVKFLRSSSYRVPLIYAVRHAMEMCAKEKHHENVAVSLAVVLLSSIGLLVHGAHPKLHASCHTQLTGHMQDAAHYSLFTFHPSHANSVPRLSLPPQCSEQQSTVREDKKRSSL